MATPRKTAPALRRTIAPRPDGNPYNNWSFPGNTNPYTGKTATGDPAAYLRGYYNRGGSTDAYSFPSFSDPSATSASDTSASNTQTTTHCGAHGHESDHGCTCDAGYANHFGACVFASCAAGSRQNAKGECETKVSTLDPTQRVNCLSHNPCVCPAGFEPLANRTCVPRCPSPSSAGPR